MKMTGKISALLIIAISALFIFAGCEKKPETVAEVEGQEHTAGETTDSTDVNAPKEIKSKDIEEFYTSFYLETRWTEDEDHSFEFQISGNEKGILTASENLREISLPADGDLTTSLQAVIDQYDLVSLNGTSRTNYSLPPEYQACTLKVTYASGEKLEFTDLNDPYAEWEEEIYTVFAQWFSDRGNDSLYPPEESSQVTRLRLELEEDGIFCQYGGINVMEADAIDGETHLLERSIYDNAEGKEISEDWVIFPEDYYERITEIIAGSDLVRNYDFSIYDREAGNFGNHDEGYYGMGSMTTRDGEPDSEKLSLTLHLEYESGKRVNIDTRKESEIAGMKELVTELTGYLDTLFPAP